MVDDEIVHIALAPPADLDADVVKTVAAVIGRSSYDTRLLLSAKIPRIVAHCDSRQIAESLVQNLRELGLAAIACRDSELRRLPQTFQAQTLGLGEREVLFRDRAGQEKKIAASGVFLILVGRIETSVETETTRTKTKFSLGRTLLMGGIPMWKRVDEKTTSQSIQTEYFARLYGRKSADPSVDILQHHLNYSFLGAEVAASSFTNFGTVVQRLREVFPKAIFDDRLASPSGLTASFGREDMEINCRLIFLFHQMTV